MAQAASEAIFRAVNLEGKMSTAFCGRGTNQKVGVRIPRAHDCSDGINPVRNCIQCCQFPLIF
jgi:hypothetical protein